MMNDMLTYNQHIALIMEGKTPVARTLATSDSTRTSKVLVMPSPEDSILRAQMEGIARLRSLRLTTTAV